MASNVPAALKSADIGRFAVRAAQLESFKPVISYWCNFYIVNQIIEKGLHSVDDEVKVYTTSLVDKLEKFKSENSDNDTVTDAVAANAYVEEFAMDVFHRAEATMKANKVTKQTADTFQAAATFLELCQIWNPPEAEVAAKTKFAKYHALRIVKAIKAGEDPNATNPAMQEEKEDDTEPGQNDPEVQAIVQEAQEEAGSRQPSVQDAPDESERPERPPPDLPKPTVPSIPSAETPTPPGQTPRAPASGMEIDDQPDSAFNLPSAPTFAASSGPVPDLPDTPSKVGVQPPQPPAGTSDGFQSFPAPSPMPPADPSSFYSQPQGAGATGPPTFTQSPSNTVPVVSRPVHQAVPTPTPYVPAGSASGQPNSVDDHAISLAQKHARWAVSALTFDDVNTAVKELKNSLKHLGVE